MPRHLFPSSASKPWLRSNPPDRSGFTRGRSLWATTPRQQAQNCVFGQYESHLCPTIDGSVKEAAACAPLHRCLRQNHSRSTRGLRYLEQAESCGSQCTHTHTPIRHGVMTTGRWSDHLCCDGSWDTRNTSWTVCPKAEALKVRKWMVTLLLHRGQLWLLHDCVRHLCSGSAAMEVLSGGRLVPVWRAVVTFWAVFCRNLGCW